VWCVVVPVELVKPTTSRTAWTNGKWWWSAQTKQIAQRIRISKQATKLGAAKLRAAVTLPALTI